MGSMQNVSSVTSVHMYVLMLQSVLSFLQKKKLQNAPEGFEMTDAKGKAQHSKATNSAMQVSVT